MTKLSEIFGQDIAVGALRKALRSNELPGSYLIVGADGTGKFALAKAFAQAATCVSPHEDPFDSCGVCDSCRRAESGSQPDILTIRPAGEQIQIWQFWDRPGRQTPGALTRTLAYAPVIGRRRVYIVESADRLTESAANSLLKALEEPPPYGLFILLAPHPARVLPTILSRCQIVRLTPIAVLELAAYLSENHSVDLERAKMLAAYCEGRIGNAITLAAVPAVGDEIERILDFAESLPAAAAHRALRAAETLRKIAGQTKALLGEEPAESIDADGEQSTIKEKTGRKQFAMVFDMLVTYYRDLLALRVGTGSEAVVNRHRLESLTASAAAGCPERWTRCLNALLAARRRLDANANVALVTETLMMALLAP